MTDAPINSRQYAQAAAKTRNYTDGLVLDNPARRLLEAGLCLPGECAELVVTYELLLTKGSNVVREDVTSEFGDCDWYRQELGEVLVNEYGFMPGFATPYFGENPALPEVGSETYGLRSYIRLMHIQSGLIANQVKKHLLHGRDIGVVPMCEAIGQYDLYRARAGKLYEECFEVSLYDIRRYNIEKLHKRHKITV